MKALETRPLFSALPSAATTPAEESKMDVDEQVKKTVISKVDSILQSMGALQPNPKQPEIDGIDAKKPEPKESTAKESKRKTQSGKSLGPLEEHYKVVLSSPELRGEPAPPPQVRVSPRRLRNSPVTQPMSAPPNISTVAIDPPAQIKKRMGRPPKSLARPRMMRASSEILHAIHQELIDERVGGRAMLSSRDLPTMLALLTPSTPASWVTNQDEDEDEIRRKVRLNRIRCKLMVRQRREDLKLGRFDLDDAVERSIRADTLTAL